MVESGEIQSIECACGKPFLWTSDREMEVQCHSCNRKILLPFTEFVNRTVIARFVDLWRRRQRGKPPEGAV